MKQQTLIKGLFSRCKNSFVLIAAIAVIIALSGQVAYASVPAGKIAFVRDFDIWIMNTDGTGQTNLTNSPEEEGNPGWSPDGQKIAFARKINNIHQIMIMNNNGSGQQQITVNKSQTLGFDSPSFSPDGRSLVFHGSIIATEFPDGYCTYKDQLLIADLSNRSTTIVRTSEEMEEDVMFDTPFFSLDGKGIFYGYRGEGLGDIKYLDMNSGAESRIIYQDAEGDTENEFYAMTLSSDGKKIAGICSLINTKLFIKMPPSNARTIFSNNAEVEIIYYVRPTFSPDSQTIAFVGENVGNTYDIWSINSDGTGLHKIASNASSPAWQPRIFPQEVTILRNQIVKNTAAVFAPKTQEAISAWLDEFYEREPTEKELQAMKRLAKVQSYSRLAYDNYALQSAHDLSYLVTNLVLLGVSELVDSKIKSDTKFGQEKEIWMTYARNLGIQDLKEKAAFFILELLQRTLTDDVKVVVNDIFKAILTAVADGKNPYEVARECLAGKALSEKIDNELLRAVGYAKAGDFNEGRLTQDTTNLRDYASFTNEVFALYETSRSKADSVCEGLSTTEHFSEGLKVFGAPGEAASIIAKVGAIETKIGFYSDSAICASLLLFHESGIKGYVKNIVNIGFSKPRERYNSGYFTRFALASPATILVTDSKGKRVGYDAKAGKEMSEIKGAIYSGKDTEPQVIIVPESWNNYAVTLNGTAEGTAHLSMQTNSMESQSKETKLEYPVTKGKTIRVAVNAKKSKDGKIKLSAGEKPFTILEQATALFGDNKTAASAVSGLIVIVVAGLLYIGFKKRNRKKEAA